MQQIGRMDRQVTLQRSIEYRTPSGAAQTDWQNVATVWAAAKPMRGQEVFQSGQRQAERVVTFVIRYRADLGPTWRIVHDGLAYDVQSVSEFGRREALEILARAEVV